MTLSERTRAGRADVLQQHSAQRNDFFTGAAMNDVYDSLLRDLVIATGVIYDVPVPRASSFHDAATPEDLPASHQGELIEDADPEPAEPEPDYDHVPFEETATYRDQMKDAGRGHLVRW